MYAGSGTATDARGTCRLSAQMNSVVPSARDELPAGRRGGGHRAPPSARQRRTDGSRGPRRARPCAAGEHRRGRAVEAHARAEIDADPAGHPSRIAAWAPKSSSVNIAVPLSSAGRRHRRLGRRHRRSLTGSALTRSQIRRRSRGSRR